MAKPVRAEVINRNNDSVDKLFRKFKKKVKKEGVMEELHRRRFYEKPSVKRRKRKLHRQRLIDQVNRLRKSEED